MVVEGRSKPARRAKLSKLGRLPVLRAGRVEANPLGIEPVSGQLDPAGLRPHPQRRFARDYRITEAPPLDDRLTRRPSLDRVAVEQQLRGEVEHDRFALDELQARRAVDRRGRLSPAPSQSHVDGGAGLDQLRADEVCVQR